MTVFSLLLSVLSQFDLFGYAETRPYLLIGDSTHLAGFNRGWIELKADGIDYGAHLGCEIIAPYDSLFFTRIDENISISRLAVWVGPETRRVIIGKQRLYWGVGRIFRPLDIFNPTNYFEPTYERAGSNVLLGYLALGDLTSIRGVIQPRYELEQSLYAARFGTHFLKNDLSASAFHRNSDRMMLVGGDIAGELLVGYWGEYGFTREDTVDYSKFSLGIDYTFPFKIYTLAEYFFDGSGVSDPSDYDYSLITRGERVTLGQQYLYTSISTIPNPFDIFRPSLSALVNIEDQGFVLIPQVNIVPYENTDIAVGLNFFFGPDNSEFVNLIPFDHLAYIWAKVYF
jgi:hypothetical protein